MSEQLNEKCAICGGYLFSDDDIVHCPKCGAPHHRDCYQTVGHCGMQEFHDTDKQYSAKQNQEEAKPRCASCGKELPQNSKYCPFCGRNTMRYTPSDDERDFVSFGTGGIVIDIYGGMDKNTVIDGVTAKDLARFVAFTPNRILPKFKRFYETGKRVSWNWMGFVSPYSHALFRKMNGAVFAYLLLELTAYVLITPFYNLFLSANLPINYTTAQLSEYIANNADKLINPAAIIMATLGFLLLIGIRIYAGLFNDWHYMRHSVDTIKEIRKDNKGEEEEKLRKKGGVRPFLSMLLLIASTYFSGVLPTLISQFLFG